MGVPLVIIHFRLGFSMNHPAIGIPPFCPLEMKQDTLLDLHPATGSNLFLDAKRLRLDAAMHVGCSKMEMWAGSFYAVPQSPAKVTEMGKKQKFHSWNLLSLRSSRLGRETCLFPLFPWLLDFPFETHVSINAESWKKFEGLSWDLLSHPGSLSNELCCLGPRDPRRLWSLRVGCFWRLMV